MQLVAVHAHPDDESLTMGGTLAKYAAAGHRVCVVTATLGEEGEVIGPAWQQLVSAEADQLGGYRAWELSAAMSALGVTDHRYLGGQGRFRDSGMADTAANDHPRAFARPDAFGDAVAALAAVLDELQPEVVLTYPADGGYGHPDHRAAAAVARAAAAQAGTRRVLASVRPQDELAAASARQPVPDGYRTVKVDALGYVTSRPAAELLGIEVSDVADARNRALAAHATQVEVVEGGFALSNRIVQPLLPVEYYEVVVGPPVPAGADDLGAGL